VKYFLLCKGDKGNCRGGFSHSVRWANR